MANDINTEILLTCKQEGLDKVQIGFDNLKNTISQTQKILNSMGNFNVENFRSLLSGEGKIRGGGNAWESLSKSMKSYMRSVGIEIPKSNEKATRSLEKTEKSVKKLGEAVKKSGKETEEAADKTMTLGEAWEKVGKELLKRTEIFASYKLLGFLYNKKVEK